MENASNLKKHISDNKLNELMSQSNKLLSDISQNDIDDLFEPRRIYIRCCINMKHVKDKAKCSKKNLSPPWFYKDGIERRNGYY